MDGYFKYKISNIPIIFEDEWLLAIDKPSGLLTIPSPKNEARTLTSVLNEGFRDLGKDFFVHPCHRLDRETSGVIIYAKGKAAQKKMMQLFKDRKVHKKYVAFVHGHLNNDQGQIRNSVEGLPALTEYKVVGKKKDFSVVEAYPQTGRTNQIRIHFKDIGHPLVGESKYVFRRHYALKGKRLFLHAKAIEFIHPQTGKKVAISITLAQDMQDFLIKHS